MSRFRTFALLAALAALATVFAACGSSSSDKSSEDPQKVIDSATLEGVESGTLDLSLGVNSEGEKAATSTSALSGPFQSGTGKERLPQLAMSRHAPTARSTAKTSTSTAA